MFQGMARDVLAGAAAMYATPFYHNIGTGTNFRESASVRVVGRLEARPALTRPVPRPTELVWPSLILAILALPLIIPVYAFVQHGWVLLRSIAARAERRSLTVLSLRSSCSTYFRDRSHFAQTLAAERHINNEYNPAKKRNAQVQHVEDAQVKR